MHVRTVTSEYYGKKELRSLGVVVPVRQSLRGGSAGFVTLWADKDGGLWARHKRCKYSILGMYRPVGRWRDENGDFFYFM